ncbi:polysaccharide deacetylase family protein [Oceanibacterium hippocampi]|uniref:Chitooligosaccharide deacetylase n=1 Tax=Oceanibacterium hippocampi TaxID=745714 RepID=A0A1Y5TWD0_9PROT|nr:polysaccharide deacetylase family protein [Oceanibacterium hippocampi]SLN75247.1 Peptidoglycan deacetylase [Oceanibacterium hippocampi]
MTGEVGDKRERDFLGYGMNRPDPKWPNDAKLALSFVVNLEEGAEDSFEDGQPVNDKLGEFQSILPDGQRDLAIEQFHEYGLRAGVWRILDLFDRYERKVTFYMCGRAVERTPQVAAEIVARGHEPALHGYRWYCHARFEDYETEKREIEKATEIIENVTGERPRGFYSMWAPSLNTRTILQEMDFVYDSNEYNDDLPYYRAVRGGPMLVVPYSLDTNDFKFIVGDPFGAPSAFLEYLKRSVEVLIEEGERGGPKLLNIGLHLRIVGRPGRLWAIQQLLEYLKSLGDDVWVARRIDIARHWLSTNPPVQDT